MINHEEFYVRLDRYTLNVFVGRNRHRMWAPFSGPILSFLPDEDGCQITMDDETRAVTLAEAERILIERGSIDPALDDPADPVCSWMARA